MNDALKRLVWERAGDTCEYCRVPQWLDVLPFQIDHVIAEQHHGTTVPENLALCCLNDNLHKGPNIAGLDPATGLLTRLFHPRQDVWDDHFAWAGPVLTGRTAIGRTTIDVLAMNVSERVELRRLLMRGHQWGHAGFLAATPQGILHVPIDPNKPKAASWGFSWLAEFVRQLPIVSGKRGRCEFLPMEEQFTAPPFSARAPLPFPSHMTCRPRPAAANSWAGGPIIRTTEAIRAVRDRA